MLQADENYGLSNRTPEHNPFTCAVAEAKHKVSTKVVAFDFTADKDAYGELSRQLQGICCHDRQVTPSS
jgi:hypothetical protein